MSVFTAYFCGTGSHRFDDANPNFWNGELVSTLASNDQGREFAHWIAVDAPVVATFRTTTCSSSPEVISTGLANCSAAAGKRTSTMCCR